MNWLLFEGGGDGELGGCGSHQNWNWNFGGW